MVNIDWVQHNESMSTRGVLRGLHFQRGDFAQSKLVRVISGAVFDVAVDLRPGSSTYGSWYGIELTGENKRQLFVPKHFAHGFLVLTDTAIFSYLCDDYYSPENDGGIRYDDPTVGIEWPSIDGNYTISDKDQNLPLLSEISVQS